MTITERFLRYAASDTQSDEQARTMPSTPGQMRFAESLTEELKALGLHDVSLDENGYVMATLPANTSRTDVPVIGFIAHMDTSPDMSGRDVKPRIVTYTGGEIVLNEPLGIVLSPDVFPELNNYVGQELIVTDGTTLLGADDKAGVAAIVSAMEYLLTHPEVEHGTVRIAFTPDEEIGRGADRFDVERFGCFGAYTVDGGEIGELEYENFNAAQAIVTLRGRNIHPGSAKGRMINASLLAMQLNDMLPPAERPETTEGREGFFHIEFFREGDDYIAIEYNNRPAGGFTIDVYNFAHSLDLYRGYAAIVAGEEFPASEFEPQYCLATSRRANAHYVYSEEDLLAKYSQQFKVKKIMPAAFAELQGDYLYMLTTPSRQEMEQMIADFGQRQA